MPQKYTLYGWHLSYFTGKALCYLRYKRVNHELKAVNMYTLLRTIKKKTGAAVMPVLKTETGQWIQDTSEIIDYIESQHPEHAVLPATPVQRFASRLLEAWGDEWWVPIAMHTRWNYPENYALFEKDAGSALLPWAPRFLQNKAARRPANMLKGMLPHVGIIPEQYDTMNQWTVNMLDALDLHFSKTPFLLGQRPSLGDFSLVGTMYGHLGRDPWPKRELVEPRRHLHAWLERMKNPAQFSGLPLSSNDEIPATLDPVFASVFREFIPMVKTIGEQVSAFAQQHGLNTRLPRRIGEVHTTMGGKPFKRASLPYMVWMLQRAMDEYGSMQESERLAVRQWLKKQGAEHLLSIPLPRVARLALTVTVMELPKQNMERVA